MSTIATASQPATSSPLKRLMSRHPLIAYFVIAIGGTWAFFLPFALSRGVNGLGLLPFTLPDSALTVAFVLATLAGPALASLTVTAVTSGRAGVGLLLRRCVQWRVGIGWYLLAIFGPLLILGVGYSVFLVVNLPLALVSKWALLFSVFFPQAVFAILTGSFAEEVGWRGFALPRLQQRYGPLLGTLILGTLHGLWHLPSFFTGLLGPFSLPKYAIFLFGAIALAFLFTWLFNHTRGSVLLAALLHGCNNAAPGLLVLLVPAHLVASGWTHAFVYGGGATGVVVGVVALLLIICTRGRLGYNPERNAQIIEAPRPAETPLAVEVEQTGRALTHVPVCLSSQERTHTMSPITTTSQPATSSPLRRVISQHPLLSFFVIAFVGAWLTALPVLLARNGLGLLPLTLPMHVLPGLDLLTLGAFTGPTLAAIIVTAATSGAAGLRQLLRRIVQWRVGAGWYLLALLGYPLLYVGIDSIALGVSSFPTLLARWSLLFTIYFPYLLVNLISTMGEEVGWVGYALPTLQQQVAPWLAAASLGALWSLWHLPSSFITGGAPSAFSPAYFVLFMVLGVTGRITWSWIFNKTRGSVIIIALLHAASNGAGIALLPRLSSPAPALGTVLFLGLTVVVFPVLILVFTRGRLSYKPERSARLVEEPRPGQTPLTQM